MFYLKGDGTDNVFQFRFYSSLEMWSSYNISLKDTNWRMVKIPFQVDTLKGLRYIGNNPDGPDFTLPPGTNEQLKTDLQNVTEVRFYVTNPVIDFTNRVIELDGLYAVDKYPPLPPVKAEGFESYSDFTSLSINWQQFGDASAGYSLTQDPDSVAIGSKSFIFSYQGVPGSEYSAVRRKNIIPGYNFSDLNGGMQFWLKGDGSANHIRFRFYNGNEMWASYPISLSSTDWQHIGIKFAADTANGFRYLGNDPMNPDWTGNAGTTAQLYGDLASVDQIRFDVLNPEQDNVVRNIVIDEIEGADAFSPDVVTDVNNAVNSALPTQYSMEQNYPNPFNPSTTIRYTVPKSSFITLKIYNLLGQEVATLLNREQTAGTHEVSFDASKLSSGVYFYSLKAGNFTSTKKMMLLK